MNKIKLVQCYHCFTISDHKRPYCPYLSQPQRCSRCAQTSHKSWECENRTFCLNCRGPHPVTASCCPFYQSKLEEIKPDLLKELSINAHRPQEVPNQPYSDAMNILITSAFMANGSPMTFINYIFSTCQALAQTSTPISPYHHYIPPSPKNQDIEFSAYYPPRNNPQELAITPA